VQSCPAGRAEARKYVDAALTWRDAGTAVPFVIMRVDDDTVVGSTRFWNLERWSWPPDHASHGRRSPDVCEIGYTWLTRSAVRTAANTEAKMLMLTHAFEAWHVLRVCFHTDSRNARPRAALELIVGQFEGILRPTVWPLITSLVTRCDIRSQRGVPAVKQRLVDLMDRE
jgi:RimJ/RimL family protein N-acetyltransferase